MQIGEILRKLADIVDKNSDPGQPDDRIVNAAKMEPIDDGQLPVEQPHNKDAAEGDDQMVPPLQLKLELLKRAVGVDNIYDEERSDETHESQAGEDVDELEIIKKRAGINPSIAVISAASDDEPLDD